MPTLFIALGVRLPAVLHLHLHGKDEPTSFMSSRLDETRPPFGTSPWKITTPDGILVEKWEPVDKKKGPKPITVLGMPDTKKKRKGKK